MKRLAIVGVLAAMTLVAAPSPGAAVGGGFDIDNGGQHDPATGAWTLAAGIGRTDAIFELCRWPTDAWRPLRQRALQLAPRIFERAGESPSRVAKVMLQTHDRLLSNPIASRQCTAGSPARQLRWDRDLVNWAAGAVRAGA